MTPKIDITRTALKQILNSVHNEHFIYFSIINNCNENAHQCKYLLEPSNLRPKNKYINIPLATDLSMIIPTNSLQYIKNTKIDYKADFMGSRFIFTEF